MDEESLLQLFENANVQIGKLHPRVIKAWFDTDCESLLKWICTSITEDCYVSAQQDYEYSQLEALPDEQLNKKMKTLESQHPDLLQVESNLFDIEIAKDTIEMLKEELKSYDHQIHVNEQLHQTLLSELSAVSAEEIQSQLQEESAQSNCMKLSQELDHIQKETYNQINKYGVYLGNYEFSSFPEFVNSIDVSEFEEKLSHTVNSLHTITTIDDKELETSSVKLVADTIPELESRIFNSRISKMALQMEVEALNSVLKFLDSYDTNLLPSFLDYDSLQMSVELSKDQQSWMMKVVEETSLKLAQQCVNQPTIRCLKNEFQFYQKKLNCVEKFKEFLNKILLHSVMLHSLYFQEKMDIKSSSKFFKNIHQYINKDIKNSTLRREAMMTLNSQYEEFSVRPIQHQFKLMGDFGMLSLKNRNVSLREVLESTNSLRANIRKLKRQQFNCPITFKILEDLCGNIRVLREFLISGPSSQIVTIPTSLQMVLLNANKIIVEQNSAVKLLINKAKTPKDIASRDEWIRYRTLLWIYFMTDGAKMLSFLEHLKSSHGPEKNVLAV